MNIDKHFGGRVIRNSLGEYYHISIDINGYEGPFSALLSNNSLVDYIRNVPDVNGESLLSLDEINTENLFHSSILYFDIETLGFGNVPVFLIGTGRFEDHIYRMEFYLARNPTEEKPIINELCNVLGDYPFLCSFNGRSFDLEHILKRAKLHRERRHVNGISDENISIVRRKVQEKTKHIDIYRAICNLKKKKERGFDHLDDLTLKSLEYFLFGFERYSNIDGRKIQTCYNNFVYRPYQKTSIDNMKEIIARNIFDVIGMPAVLFFLLRGESLENKIFEK